MFRNVGRKDPPIALLRTFVAIVDDGSFTKAGKTLGLMQAGVSAQIKRLGEHVGGDIFADGTELTRRGEVVLDHARRILAQSEHLMADVGQSSAPRALTIGIPHWFSYPAVGDLLARFRVAPTGEAIVFRSELMQALARDLVAGKLDLAFLCNVDMVPAQSVARWMEPLHWIKSPKLVLIPDMPLPYVSWPGTLPDRIAAPLLREHGIAFQIGFSSPSPALRTAAVEAGVGVYPNFERTMVPGLQVAADGFLPKLPLVETGLFARQGLNLRRLADFLSTLVAAVAPKPAPSSGPASTAGDQPKRRRRDSARGR
jgi:DNA-binding transcriptional LysR family regulator